MRTDRSQTIRRMLAIAVVIAGLAGAAGCGSDKASGTPVLALVAADCHISVSSPIAGCYGQVKNLTSSAMVNLQVGIAWLDSNGQVVARSKPRLIDADILPAGETTGWQVESDYGEDRRDYRIEFYDSNGAKLETVDQTGQ